MPGRGSRFHAALDSRRWAAARRAALRRAGFRSEISGLVGKLEVHHRVKLSDGGDPYSLDNLVVMTRAEHIEHHRREHDVPGAQEWRDLVRALVAERMAE